MKKLLIIALLFASCKSKNTTQKSTNVVINGISIEIFTIDSCEYIGSEIGFNTGILTHKGNCSNPIHSKQTLTIDTVIHINITKSKQELEEEKLQRELDELTLKLDKATKELKHNLNILEQYER